MIYCNISQSNRVVATLKEKTDLWNPYYIWTITDNDTQETFTFSADDCSNAPWVYNQFTFSITPGATYGLTQGIVPASQGVYSYRVWATPNQYSLDASTASVVEVGIFQIIGTSSIKTTYQNQPNIIPTYKKL